MNPILKKQKKQKMILGTLFFAAVFFFLCIIKLWYAVLISFAFGIVLTFIQKKRGFCYYFCPIGNLQDIAFDSKPGKKQRRPIGKLLFKTAFFVLFFGYILFYLLYFYPDDFTIWQGMVRLVAFSAVLSVRLQEIFIKRFFCIFLCPIGSIMEKILLLFKKRQNQD